LRIPVVANGGIETFQDVALAFEETGADAVMSSGILIYHALWRNSANSSSFFYFFFMQRVCWKILLCSLKRNLT
jgi:isopentenyl diphosphate isomerase/L-lactate dehydrogenase-like FMN-dependent dehydrogenase